MAHELAAATVILVAVVAPPALADDSALSLADLGRYRAALIARDPEPPALPASFRSLWDHPDRYQDRRVQVEARVVRRFRQGAYGTSPRSVEVWAVTPRGEPFCWVYPESGGARPVSPRDPVRFVGTYLKRIRLRGGRCAPARRPDRGSPVALSRAGVDPAAEPARMARVLRVDWIVGLVAGLVVAAVLVAQHLRKPLQRSAVLEPAPEFGAIRAPRTTTPRALLRHDVRLRVSVARCRIVALAEDEPARHREADPGRRHDAHHGRRQPVAVEERDVPGRYSRTEKLRPIPSALPSA